MIKNLLLKRISLGIVLLLGLGTAQLKPAGNIHEQRLIQNKLYVEKLLKRVEKKAIYSLSISVQLILAWTQASPRTKQIIKTIVATGATIAALKKLYPILYPIYKDWKYRRNLHKSLQTIEQSSLVIGEASSNKRAIEPRLNKAAGPIWRLILQYATPLPICFEIPINLNLKVYKTGILQPKIDNNGNIQILLLYKWIPCSERLYCDEITLNLKTGRTSKYEYEKQRPTLTKFDTKQDTILNDGRPCSAHLEILPTDTGLLTVSIYDTCYPLAQKLAAQAGMSVEDYLLRDPIPRSAETGMPSAVQRMLDEDEAAAQGGVQIPTEPLMLEGAFGAPAARRGMSSSSGTTDSQCAHQERAESKEEKR